MHCHAFPSTALRYHASQSSALCYHALSCITKYCLMLPCTIKHYHALAQPNHGIVPMITHRCARVLCAPCPQSVSGAYTVRSASRPCCLPSDPTSESQCALLLLGFSHGCKATHEALPHVDPQLRSQRGLQTHPYQLRSTSMSTQTEDCHLPFDFVQNNKTTKASQARCLFPPTNPHCVLLKNPTLPHLRSPWHDFPQPLRCTTFLSP